MHGNWFGPIEDHVSDVPMTQHIVLHTSDPKSLVWVTDTIAAVDAHTFLDMEKIRYLPQHQCACSAWGEYAFVVRDSFVSWVEDGKLTLDPALTGDSLRGFLKMFNTDIRPEFQNPARGDFGLIAATFFEGFPRIHIAVMNKFSIESPAENLWAGDENNPGRVFADYYYRRSQRTVEDALMWGIHSLRIAHALKAAYIGEPNAWVFRDETFKRIEPVEMEQYIELSESLDASILATRSIRQSSRRDL